LGLLTDRRWQLVSQRQRATCQLHALLAVLVPAGANVHLTSNNAAALLRKISPGSVVELERKLIARELVADIRALDQRIPAANRRLSEALAAYGTTLTDIHGIGSVGAATILSIVDDVSRFPPMATSRRSPAPHRWTHPRAMYAVIACPAAGTVR
jgi:transposase